MQVRNVLLVGGGGREAALAWKLESSPWLGRLFVTHENPGFPARAERLPPGPVVPAAVKAGVDLVIVGPEGPLAEGLVDAARAAGLAAFGPTKAAARLEASKGFAKACMERWAVPTAAGSRHERRESALAAVAGPCVVKADGLAAGKGVYVCASEAEARDAVNALFDGGSAAVVVEELLEGEEVSVFALCDGVRFVTFPPARDHKRRFDGDVGPNTGGMGAYAPTRLLDEAALATVEAEVIAPVLRGMAADGAPFTGVLYAGLMLTTRGIKVLEFNVRFGDPECQPLMVLLDEDLLPRLWQCATGTLDPTPLQLRGGVACCVVVVAEGYPGAVEKGAEVEGIEAAQALAGVVVFHAGTALRGGRLVANGGRLLGVTGWGPDLGEARARAYAGVHRLRLAGSAWRGDIAARELAAGGGS